MSTCKDCLHERVCNALIKSGLPYDELLPAEAFCMTFRNKADYVEVVFCKDCKFWERLYYRPFVEPRDDGRCKALWQFHDAERNITFEDHFCSYGERKEKNNA